METAKEYAEALIADAKKIEEIEEDLRRLLTREYRYKLSRILENHQSMFDRFCPFKIGDRIQLTAAPEISDKVSWGWLGSEHFLVPGSVGTIASLDFSKDLFVFGVIFDNESWISSFDKVEHYVPLDQRHTFRFNEKCLAPIAID